MSPFCGEANKIGTLGFRIKFFAKGLAEKRPAAGSRSLSAAHEIFKNCDSTCDSVLAPDANTKLGSPLLHCHVLG
jgi:hypothetical protein